MLPRCFSCDKVSFHSDISFRRILQYCICVFVDMIVGPDMVDIHYPQRENNDRCNRKVLCIETIPVYVAGFCIKTQKNCIYM